MNLLLRYLSKSGLRPFWIFLLIILIFTCAADIFLSLSKNRVSDLADRYFSQKLSVQRSFFVPPNLIILKNISFSQDDSGQPRQIIFVPTLSIKFSLIDLLISRQFSISDLEFYRPDFDYYELKRFLNENFIQLVDFIKDLPLKDVRLKIKGSRFKNLKQQQNPGFVYADFFLKLKDELISGWGSVRRSRDTIFGKNKEEAVSMLIGPATRFRFKAFLTYGGCSLENFELMRENLYAKLWGNIKSSVLRLNGFVFINTLYKDSSYRQPDFSLIEKLNAFIQRMESTSDIVGLPKANIFILDIDGQLNFKLPQLSIERLNFSFNNAPVCIKGDINFSDTIGINISASSFMTRFKDTSAESLRRADLTLAGTIDEKTLRGDGMLDFDFVAKKKKGSPPLDKFSMDFKKMALNFEQFPVISMELGEADLLCSTDTNTYRINLKDFWAESFPGKSKFNKVEFGSKVYDGTMKGKGWIDWSKFPPKISAVIRVKGLSSSRLEGILMHFSKVFGKLSSQMCFVNYPDMYLRGSAAMQKGRLVNFEFFKWLSDLFALPSLKKVDFNKARFNFSVDSRGAGLSKIDLTAPEVGVDGYFNLGENDMVSSKLTLTLSRELLKESSKFTPLLRLIEKDIESLRFNFQLSGNLHRMNFQWLKSDLKSQLQDSMPHFIEWQIEKKVQDIIDSIEVK